MSDLRRWVAIGIVALVVACESAPAPTVSPSASAPEGELADVLTYKVDNERTGIMPGQALVNEPRILWEVALEAGSAASPLVHDGQVIIAPRDGRIQTFDPESGHPGWSLNLHKGIPWTPTIADGILYVVTEDSVLHAIRLDTRGSVWTAKGFLDETIITVVGDLVLAGSPGQLVALSTADGKERWRQKTGGSDRVATDGSVAYVGGDGSGLLTALAVDDGAEQWQQDLKSARVLTPVVVDDGLVAATRDTPGGHNFVVGLAADGAERWRWEPFERGRIAAFTVDAERVFIKSDVIDTAFQAIDIKTGKELWTQRLPGQLQMIPVVAEQTVYVGGREAGITAFDTTTGDNRWALAFDGLMGGGMVLTGGLLIAAIQEEGAGGRVVALADPADKRHAALASAAPTDEPSATPVAGLPLEVLFESVIPGESLPLGAAVAPDGTMYVADMLNHRVVIRHPDGRLEYWGEHGSGEGEFDFSLETENDSSTSIAVSPDGELIAVADGHNHRVQLFDGSRNHLGSIGRLGRDTGQFVNPCCLTVDAEHRIWVTDTARADVQVFDENGTHLDTFGSPGSGNGELARPGIPFVDLLRDEVYIPDFANRRVSVFSTDGTWLRHYDRQLNDELRFDEVNHVAVDRAGRVFVVDTTNRMFVLERDGTLLHKSLVTAPGLGSMEPGPFVLRDNGTMYLTDISGTTEARLIIGQLGAPLWPPPAP
jgi:outer membrane protein assembly factor BamB